MVTEVNIKGAKEALFGIRVSPMLTAILEFSLSHPEPQVTPRITSLAITSDGFLMGWPNDQLKEVLLGSEEDFHQNLTAICHHADLTPLETKLIIQEVYSNITDWRS